MVEGRWRRNSWWEKTSKTRSRGKNSEKEREKTGGRGKAPGWRIDKNWIFDEVNLNCKDFCDLPFSSQISPSLKKTGPL